jgi:protein required for attachment to host cells
MGNQARVEWLVVVNREHAKLFSKKAGKIEFIKKIENVDGGLRDREFQTDRPGANHGRFISSGHSYSLDAGKEPSRHVEEVFARTVAEALKRDFAMSHVTHAFIAAEPRMTGMLKAHVTQKMILTPLTWLQEDWAKLPNSKIEALLAKMDQGRVLAIG